LRRFSLVRSELEEWMATSVGDILLERIVDANPVSPQDADGRSCAWPEQGAWQARASERLERASNDGTCLLGRELGGLYAFVTVALSDDRRAGGPKVCPPASLAVCRLDESAAVELDDADRYRARLARSPTATPIVGRDRGAGRHCRRVSDDSRAP
jgi:hypothetical protein